MFKTSGANVQIFLTLSVSFSFPNICLLLQLSTAFSIFSSDMPPGCVLIIIFVFCFVSTVYLQNLQTYFMFPMDDLLCGLNYTHNNSLSSSKMSIKSGPIFSLSQLSLMWQFFWWSEHFRSFHLDHYLVVK